VISDLINLIMASADFKKFTICVTGPSYVGKTSFLNRLISNTFHNEYFPTHEVEKFKLVYKMQNDSGGKVDYICIEIHDTFPIDHPNLISNDNSMEKEKKFMEK